MAETMWDEVGSRPWHLQLPIADTLTARQREIVSAMRALSEDGRFAPSSVDHRMYMAARREFTSWDGACQAAGLRPRLTTRLRSSRKSAPVGCEGVERVLSTAIRLALKYDVHGPGSADTLFRIMQVLFEGDP